MLNKTLTFIFLISLLFLTGCTTYRVHKISIQQGNIIEQEKVNQLKPGMRKDQVQFLLGTPVLKDMFHKDRWDYIYTFKPGYGPLEKKRFTVFFEDDALVNIVGDLHPQVDTIEKQKMEEVVVVPVDEYQPEAKKKWYQGWFDGLKWWKKEEVKEDKPIPGEPEPGATDPNINFPKSEKNIK